MKITKKQLKQIIKEELGRVLNEQEIQMAGTTVTGSPDIDPAELSDEDFVARYGSTRQEMGPEAVANREAALSARATNTTDPMVVTGTPGLDPDALSDEEFYAEYGSSREEMGPDAVAARQAYLSKKSPTIAPIAAPTGLRERRRRRSRRK